MNREILFRAKERGKKNFIYGYYAKIGNKDCIICVDVEEFRDENLERRNGNQAVEIDENTICQYTGLTDKNGTKIFENDIVFIKCDDECYAIRWKKTEAKFVVSQNLSIAELKDYWAGLGGYRRHDIRVIGNIFDNQTAED